MTRWLTSFTLRGFTKEGILLAIALGGVLNFGACVWNVTTWTVMP